MAIGGTLTDGTPGETGPVAGHSFVGQLASGSTFNWQGGVTEGMDLPVDFGEYVYLASAMQQTATNGQGVWVVDQGGCYRESNAAMRYWDLYDFVPGDQPSQINGRRLVVFVGEGTVGIKGTVDNRQFGLSIMAPRAHVVIDESVGYIDGCIHARSVSMIGSLGSRGAGVQIHCNCFNGPIECIADGMAPPPPPCFDIADQKTCDKIVSKNKCSRQDAIADCRKSCGHCGGCPTSRPPPPPADTGCFWPQMTTACSLITLGDAKLASTSHYKGLCVGGTLINGLSRQSGTVGAKSWVTDIGDAAAAFSWADGVTVGEPLPFVWSEFKALAKALRPGPNVIIINQGGVYTGDYPVHHSYSMDDLCNGHTQNDRFASACQASSTGQNTLVVFLGKGTVGIEGTASGRAFMGTILAPWAHVIGLGSSSYIDGTVIARSFESAPGCDQMHAYLYNGPLLCDSGVSGACADTKSEKFCTKRVSLNKCDKRGVRKKCTASCGLCE